MPPLDPEPNEEEKQEKLDDDYEPPFSLPDDSHAVNAADPQSLDQNLEDPHELYDEGINDKAKSVPIDEESAGYDVETEPEI